MAGFQVTLRGRIWVIAEVDIFRGLEHRLSVVETTAQFHGQRIEQLFQWMIASPNLEEDVERTAKGLNDLSGRHDKKLHELEIKIEKDLNEMGRSIRHEIITSKDGMHKEIINLKDGEIAKLNQFASIAKGIGLALGALITGGILLEVVKRLWH
jgi:hypothetical protein